MYVLMYVYKYNLIAYDKGLGLGGVVVGLRIF